MNNRRFSVPEQKNYELAHQQAYKIAREKLAALKDIEEQCRKSGARYRKTGAGAEVTIRYLDEDYVIQSPGAEVVPAGREGEVPLREKLLILHYFLSAGGKPLSGNLITFRELPEGKVYLPTFAKRTTGPLTRFFGGAPERLLETAGKLGGQPAEYGDTSVSIQAFRYVPVSIVIWKGDDEFPPECNILFDSTVTDYLSGEDTIVLCEVITWKLVRLLS
jgi:hypothetical protein